MLSLKNRLNKGERVYLHQAFPAGGIHIFASQLHTHLAGLGVRTVLVRGDKEVAVVQEDKHFSTHYQVFSF